MDSLFDPGSIKHQRRLDMRLQSVSRLGSGSAPGPHRARGPEKCTEDASGGRGAAEEVAKTFLLSDPFFQHLSVKNALPAAVLNVRICCFSSVLGPPGLEEPVQVCGRAVVQVSRVFFTASDRCSDLAPSRCEERWPGWKNRSTPHKHQHTHTLTDSQSLLPALGCHYLLITSNLRHRNAEE